jgi:uncharacterized protein (DUF2147 family)
MMRKLFAVAAFVLASTAAQAQYTFDYGGRTIRIDPDRGTVSIPGVYDNSGRRAKRSDRARKPQTPEQAKIDPQTPVGVTSAPTEQNPAAVPAADANTATANVAPVETPAATPAPAIAPAPQTAQDPAPVAKPAPPPVVATAPVAAPVQTPAPVTAAAPSPNSPLGIWLTEEKEGKVRIEQCGINLCGYSVDAKSNQNGEQVLINMKAGKDSKWSGRIYDPNTGSTYESTIALKGTDSLRVQGCAFSGMFCGGQTWSRLN